jgi:hypothetical protein
MGASFRDTFLFSLFKKYGATRPEEGRIGLSALQCLAPCCWYIILTEKSIRIIKKRRCGEKSTTTLITAPRHP